MLRLGGIALACIAVALWFFYDGAIAYPNQRVRALRYHEFAENDQLESWEAFAVEQGWSTDDPGEPKSDYDIMFQFVIGALSISVGVVYSLTFLSYLGRWIEMDDEGLRTSGGKTVAFSEITALDKRRWHDKGIAKITFRGEQRKGRLVLDDWKFEDAPIESMLKEIEARISRDKIRGDMVSEDTSETAEGGSALTSN